MTDIQDKIITVTAVLNCSEDSAFDYFTDNSLLTRWLTERPYYLNFEWRGNADQKSFMNNVRPLTNVTVIFSKLDDSKTKVTLIHTGWRPTDDWETARQYFVKAWTGAFKQLEKFVNS